MGLLHINYINLVNSKPQASASAKGKTKMKKQSVTYFGTYWWDTARYYCWIGERLNRRARGDVNHCETTKNKLLRIGFRICKKELK